MRDEPRCAHQYLLYFAALTQTFIYVLFFADRFYHRRDRCVAPGGVGVLGGKRGGSGGGWEMNPDVVN